MSENSCSSASSCTKESCEGCSQNQGKKSMLEPANKYSNIKKVIAVMSGKGGVGKSTVTSSLAVELTKKGYKVGILDSDVTGPSIPKMFGLAGMAEADERGIIPGITECGIKVMSVNLLLQNVEEPVIWRGPVIAGVVKQFWSEVVWGDLDYLLIDMPPGTGDVPLTVFQSIPVDGAVIVTSPQDLVQLIVKKAYNMAKQMDIPVLGIIENYSYIECPDCGKKMSVFGESKVDKVAESLDTKVLGKLPIKPEMASLADKGDFDKASNPFIESALEVITKEG